MCDAAKRECSKCAYNASHTNDNGEMLVVFLSFFSRVPHFHTYISIIICIRPFLFLLYFVYAQTSTLAACPANFRKNVGILSNISLSVFQNDRILLFVILFFLSARWQPWLCKHANRLIPLSQFISDIFFLEPK